MGGLCKELNVLLTLASLWAGPSPKYSYMCACSLTHTHSLSHTHTSSNEQEESYQYLSSLCQFRLILPAPETR